MNPSSGNDFGSFNNNGDGFSNAGFSSGNSFGSSGISSGGDIVLDNGASQKKKGPVIVLIVLVILAVLAGVGYVVWNSFGRGSGNYLSEWNQYYNLLMYGKTSDDEIENKGSRTIKNWYPVVVADYDSEDEIASYYNSLNSIYEKFRLAVKKTEYNDESYDVKVKLFSIYNTLSLENKKILSIYLDNGIDAAQKYIEGLSGGSSETVQMDTYLADYFKAKLELMKIYNNNGCYKDGEEDVDCMNGVSDNESYLLSKATAYNWLVYYYDSVFCESFFDDTLKKNELMEINSEK